MNEVTVCLVAANRTSLASIISFFGPVASVAAGVSCSNDAGMDSHASSIENVSPRHGITDRSTIF